jgi:predicted O-methyltransferase YrrM
MTALNKVGGSYAHPDDPGEPTTGVPRLSVTDAEAAILAERVAGLHVLEVGTGLGVSTRAMAATAATVHTVDIDPWVIENIWPDLPDNVDRTTAVPQRGGFGAVFIDGDHSTEATLRDIGVALSLLGPDGFVLVHDANYPKVRKAIPDDAEILDTEHGIAVIPHGTEL